MTLSLLLLVRNCKARDRSFFYCRIIYIQVFVWLLLSVDNFDHISVRLWLVKVFSIIVSLKKLCEAFIDFLTELSYKVLASIIEESA